MPAKASMAAGFLFSSRAVSAEGRLESATAAFIFAVGAAAMTKAEDANKAVAAKNTVAHFIFLLPKISWPNLTFTEELNYVPSLLSFSGGHGDGITRFLLGSMDHQRAFHAGDILFRRHDIGDEALERRQVARHAFENEIHLARQHVAFAHFRPAPRAFLEMLEIAILLAGQTHKDKTGDFKAQRFAVQFGVIAFDETRFLQSADAAQAGR